MTEIANRSAGALAVQPAQTDWTPDQLAALDSLGIDDTATPGDLKVFLTYAQRTGLDPFARQIYLIGRNVRELMNGQWRWRKRYSIQVGIDGFRVIANRTGAYRGQTGPQWCGEDGQWLDVWLSSEPPAAARVGVLRDGFPAPMMGVALLREYAPRNDQGELMAMWAKMPSLMLAKVAEALALRKAFPNDLSGVYVAEEMDQAPPRVITGPNAPPRSIDDLAREAAAANEDQLREIWREASAQRQLEIVITDPGTGEIVPFGQLLERLAAQFAAPSEQPGDTTIDDPVSTPAPVVDEPHSAAESVDADPWSAPAGEPS